MEYIYNVIYVYLNTHWCLQTLFKYINVQNISSKIALTIWLLVSEYKMLKIQKQPHLAIFLCL